MFPFDDVIILTIQIWWNFHSALIWILNETIAMNSSSGMPDAQGWGLLSQFSPFRYFPHFPLLPKQTLAIEYRVHIWQVSPQLSCGDTCQICMWIGESNRYFCKIEKFAYGEISERSFSNPHPWYGICTLLRWSHSLEWNHTKCLIKQNCQLHRIWILMEKDFSEMGLWTQMTNQCKFWWHLSFEKLVRSNYLRHQCLI